MVHLTFTAVNLHFNEVNGTAEKFDKSGNSIKAKNAELKAFYNCEEV